MPREKARTKLLACGIFAREYGLLDAALRARFEPVFVDSMLHMHPDRLGETLDGLLAAAGDAPAVGLFGDCCPRSRELFSGPARARVACVNCVELALGRERYRELRKARTFFFMPEWAERWEEVFARELGLGDPELARDFLQDEMSQIVYVDTGVVPVPEATLAEIEARFGLPVRIERSDPGALESALRTALDKVDGVDRAESADGRAADAGDEAASRESGPPGAGSAEGGAFEFLFSDLVERTMSLADRPADCLAFIAHELRQLVGVRTIFVYADPGPDPGRSPELALLAALPERRRTIGEGGRLLEIAAIARSGGEPFFIRPGDGTRAGSLLAELGVGESLALPLRYAGNAVGAILLLDLLDKANLGTVIDTLGRLSSVLALIIRTARLYGNLEAAVAERTREIEVQREAVAASLREKEAMLKEIHHRVKNNLQIVSSLLHLKMGTLDDPAVRELFSESESRIRAMALVHEELYRSGDLGRVEISDYIERLARSLAAVGDVELDLDAERAGFPIDAAVPCGLVLNELVMNAVKYGKGDRGTVRVGIRFARRGDEFVLEVRDDGPGLPPGFAPGKTGGVGLSIVEALAGQLRGELLIGEGKGARLTLVFPAP
ncbi:MAG: DUF1638 domain-containing protein [Spirochaetales bacterium]|nr:DUF1638 domain-containing protein [Spirochaetales bacterium]